MSEFLMPTINEVPPPVLTKPERGSLMTPLGVVEGEVLAYLDRHEMSTLRQLRRELECPAYLVMMAIGALIRAGLVRGVQRDLEVIVKLRRPLPAFC